VTHRPDGLLGAHVSTAGGVELAPARGRTIGATAIQIFTKTPNQWREPQLTEERVEHFKEQRRRANIRAIVSHDSYLINLASPDKALWRRSLESFIGELERCRQLGVEFVVTHPGNFIDSRTRGLAQNADGYSEALTSVSGPAILVETTAGSGTALGSRFEELAELRAKVSPEVRGRVGFCADTCHLFAAGYDLVDRWRAVWNAWDEIIGLEHLRCLHLNDSKNPMGSRRDRHELIGEGTLGPDPFRRIMRERPFRPMIKIIETPKGADAMQSDRRMLRRLRGYWVNRPRVRGRAVSRRRP
jgi:deoxyribonuclease IV